VHGWIDILHICNHKFCYQRNIKKQIKCFKFKSFKPSKETEFLPKTQIFIPTTLNCYLWQKLNSFIYLNPVREIIIICAIQGYKVDRKSV